MTHRCLLDSSRLSTVDKYNQPLLTGQISVTQKAIPIIIYHRIDNSGAPYTTTVNLFAKEMK